jgi:hypothetical protein
MSRVLELEEPLVVCDPLNAVAVDPRRLFTDCALTVSTPAMM